MRRNFGPVHGDPAPRTVASIKDKPFTVYTESDIHALARMRGISWGQMHDELIAAGRKIQLANDDD